MLSFRAYSILFFAGTHLEVIIKFVYRLLFFFSSRSGYTRWPRDWSSDVCSSDLIVIMFWPAKSAVGGSAEPRTALFAGQNMITIGAFRVLRRLGLHRRIALIGFDDILLADLLEDPESVV